VIPAEKNRIFGLDVLRVTAIVLVLAACHGLVLLAIPRCLGPKTAIGLERNTILWCVTAWALSLTGGGIGRLEAPSIPVERERP
jgi:hypothetical protein